MTVREKLRQATAAAGEWNREKRQEEEARRRKKIYDFHRVDSVSNVYEPIEWISESVQALASWVHFFIGQ